MRTRELDPAEAARLYDEGRSWAEIGRILAEKRGRRSPFQGVNVQRVVRAYRRMEPQSSTAVATAPSPLVPEPRDHRGFDRAYELGVRSPHFGLLLGTG